MVSPDAKILELLSSSNPYSNRGFFSEVGMFLQERIDWQAAQEAEMQFELDLIIRSEQDEIIERLGETPADVVVLYEALDTDQRALIELQQ